MELTVHRVKKNRAGLEEVLDGLCERGERAEAGWFSLERRGGRLDGRGEERGERERTFPICAAA